MDIPRFDEHIRKGGAPGEAFQEFVHELLLPDYPGLHFFQTGGVDGGIDLIQTEGGSRRVVECKDVGTDGLDEARRRWVTVANNLKNNLAGADGPARAQYEPWYKTDLVIAEYIFCVSSEMGNLRQADALADEISGFFAEMAARHSHLSHLSAIKITVLDWSDLRTRLAERPHLLFRWFKLLRDYGLKTLEESADHSTFRSYLYGEKLPYYARREHLAAAAPPEGKEVADEDGLLHLLEGEGLSGLVLTGAGGVGKTRLTLEVGWRAQEQGWVVLRVLRRLKEGALGYLAGLLTPDAKALLVIDYVETQRDFDELVTELNEFNDDLGLRLRYVANCRTSYYRAIAGVSRQRKIDISPSAEDPALECWYEDYRRSTVHHILGQSGITVTDRHLEVCRDIPVLAVFISYLHTKGQEPELKGLLEEADFTRWLVKRLGLLEKSVGDAPILPRLAQLVALFPMPSAASHHEELRAHRTLFDGLAADGWIEEFPPDEEYRAVTWRAAHDVLADQILLFHFESIPRTVEHFVRDLLSLARRVGCLRSALTTLQRLADRPALKALDWPALLDAAIAEEPAAWHHVRDLLVRTPLLTIPQIIDLLGRHDEVWRGAEEELQFQMVVGWYARRALEQAVSLDAMQRETVKSWLQRIAPHAAIKNYALTSGIKFCPELVREAALNWIRTRPLLFQTHYLMVAWLEQGLRAEDITVPVIQWAAKFSRSLNLSFIARTWLEAGGDRELLRAPVQEWLAEHGTHPEARFVYRAWLDANVGKESIEKSLLAWLSGHGTLPEAQFVYAAWLKAGGDKDAVKDRLMAWLAEHGADSEARFVYAAWLNAGGDKDAVKDRLMAWLAEYGADSEAQFVYTAWLDAKGDKEAVEKEVLAWLAGHGAIPEASFVYRAWLNAGGDKDAVKDRLMAWLAEHAANSEARFVYTAWLDARGDKKLIQEVLMDWLSEHGSELGAQFVYFAWLNAGGSPDAVRPLLLAWLAEHGGDPEARFVYTAWLDAKGDKEAVEKEVLAWLAGHGAIPEASFVYRAWLDAGGDKGAVEKALLAWLAEHGTAPEGDFVYRAWLDAGGNKESIKEAMTGWLNLHGAGPEADFIFKAWLEKGGSFDIIREYAIQWLGRNHSKKEAVFLTKYLARQPDIPTGTIKDVLSWCRHFSDDVDAIWRLTQLGKNLMREEVAEEVCATSEVVLSSLLLTQPRLMANERVQINHFFSYLTPKTAFNSEELRGRVDSLLLQWLRHPSSYGGSVRSHFSCQRTTYVQRVMNLVVAGALRTSEDRGALERFLKWVNEWEPESKSELKALLSFMEREHPAEGLWEIVKFE